MLDLSTDPKFAEKTMEQGCFPGRRAAQKAQVPSPPPYSFLGRLFESHQGGGYFGVFICLNMGGSSRGGCRVSRLEKWLQRVGGLEEKQARVGVPEPRRF